jgi:hypothetical protein
MSDCNAGTNFIQGAINGYLGLFGAGEFMDPLGDANKDYNEAKQNMQEMINTNSLLISQATQSEIKDLYEFISENNEKIQTQINLSNQIVNNLDKKETLFSSVLGVILVMLIFFFLIQKKCC